LNILYVTFGLPVPPDSGARLRDFNLLRRVAEHHSVWVLSLLEFEDELEHAPELLEFCQQVDGVVAGRPSAGSLAMAAAGLFRKRPVATATYYYPEMANKIAELTRRVAFDVAQFEHSFLAPYRSALPPDFKGTTVLSLHNIGVQQYRTMLDMSAGISRIPAALKWWLMQGWEAPASEEFDRVIAVSDDDRERLRELGAQGHISVIENGVDCSVLQPLASPGEETEEILFIGTMGYLPNRDAARYFCQSIFPLVREGRPGCVLNLVGSGGLEHLSDLEKPGVVNVTGRVKDPVPYYERSRLAVVPLRSGGGSRLKILEAMALGRPVVSTSLGREGLRLQDGHDILTADDPGEFANAVIRLLEDRNCWHDMARAGRKTVEEHYDWDLLATRLIELYEIPPGAARANE
jgi:glycosyltransferase involved in cell wall biosynthesis